jgi:hypothetical protein
MGGDADYQRATDQNEREKEIPIVYIISSLPMPACRVALLNLGVRGIHFHPAAANSYSGRHHITVTNFRCPKCEAQNFFEKSPRG